MYRRLTPPFLPFLLNYQVQNLLGEGDDDTTCKGQEPVGSLGRVVRLEGHTHLHDTEAQKDKADCSNEAEDYGGKVVHHSYRIFSRKGNCGSKVHGKDDCRINCHRNSCLAREHILFVFKLHYLPPFLYLSLLSRLPKKEHNH